MPVRADIQERPQFAVEVADEDGRFEQVEGDEVAGPCEVAFDRERMPRGVEQVAEFRPVLGFGGVVFGPQQVAKVMLVGEHRGVGKRGRWVRPAFNRGQAIVPIAPMLPKAR